MSLRRATVLILSLFFSMGARCVSVGIPVVPGVPGGPFDPPIFDAGITITVINNSDFEIDPFIDAEDFDFFLYDIDFGIVFPGEIVSADFFCDELLTLSSTEAEQYVFDEVWVLDPLPIFEQDFDYFCGEEVTLEFFGNGPDFDVIVDANGEIIF